MVHDIFVACVPSVFDYEWTRRTCKQLKHLENPIIQAIKSPLAFLSAAYCLGTHKKSVMTTFGIDDINPSDAVKNRLKSGNDFVKTWKNTSNQPVVAFMSADELNKIFSCDAKDGDFIRMNSEQLQ